MPLSERRVISRRSMSTMTKAHILVLPLIALVPSSIAAADSYPVSGRWTYDNASAPGPAQTCGTHTMEFRGAQRLDTGGGVPEYRNVSVSKSSPSLYRVVDEFFTVQIRGRMDFTLRIVDPDHIEIHNGPAGKTVMLRRCA
jgi:hypothetical protein